jgi:lipoprotein-anchoring transpeptidase ErfK/SrfK
MIRWTIALTASVIGCAVPGAALAQYYPSANPAESRPYRAGPIDIEYRRPVGFEPPRPPARIGESSPRTGPSDPRYAGLRSDDQPSRSIEDGSGAPRPPATIGEPSPLTAGGHPGGHPRYAALPQNDQPEEGDPQELAPQLRRQLVDYRTSEPAGTLIVDTPHTYLYLVLGTGKALRYGIGVGREGFTWSGEERVSRMSHWPDWHPPADMLERQPYLPRFMAGARAIRSAPEHSISASRSTAFTAPTSLQPSGNSSPRAAFACSMRTSRISTGESISARGWWYSTATIAPAPARRTLLS